MKKSWRFVAVAAMALSVSAMPVMAQQRRAESGRAVRNLREHPRAERRGRVPMTDAAVEEGGVLLIEDMGDQPETPTADRSNGHRHPATRPIAWQDAIDAERSVAGVPILEEEEVGGTCQQCGTPACGGSCGEGAAAPCGRWAHCTGVFGEYLYLRARDAEVTYASPVDGAVVPIPGPGNQVGPVGIVDPDFASGARIGFTWAWDPMTSVRGTYTHFESDTSNAISAQPGDFVLAAVTHPGVDNAANNWLDGAATLDVDFQLADVEYRWLVSYSDRHAVNLLAGVRYGELVQDFRADFSVNGSRSVDTRVRFEGGGLRVGFDAERYAACTGWLVYGRGAASFVGGQFRGSFLQRSSFADPEINTAWKAGRVVTMLDLELGLGWQSRSGCLRLTAGYLFSAWLNTVQTDTFIGAVQANRFADLGGETTTFDGLTARVEYRF